MKQGMSEYIVREKIMEAPNIATLKVTLADGTIPHFVSGQFVTVYFPDSGTPEGKAYSISSAPHEEMFSITIKAIGEFSNRLCAMHPGDTIAASLPYGYFTNEEGDEKSTLILLAAGIGVAPFRSIVRDTIKKNPAQKISLFYSSKTLADLIFKEEFDALQRKHPNFTVSYFVTREDDLPVGIIHHRMTTNDILKKFTISKNLECMVCGRISFNRDLWRALRSVGVPEDLIATEAFFS